MSQADPTPDNNGQNIMELNEQPEAKQKQAIPPRKLREIKHVNYSKYFSEDPDNSEDYQPEESSQKPEPPKKRARPKSVTKGEASNKKKKTENQENNQNPENKMELEENKPQEEQINKEAENADKNNRNNNFFGTIVDIAEIMKRYVPQGPVPATTGSPQENNTTNNVVTPSVNNVNNLSIPNSELILIMLEVCLNSTTYGIDKDNQLLLNLNQKHSVNIGEQFAKLKNTEKS